jgi:hypothetical protein
VVYQPPTVGLPALPAICLLIVALEISSFPLPPSLVCFQCSCPLCCLLVFSLLFIVQFCFFLFCRGICLPRGLCWFIPGWLGEYHVMLGAHLFGLPNVSQAGLEPVAGNSRSPPVFSV